jgi:hypothetical protein
MRYCPPLSCSISYFARVRWTVGDNVEADEHVVLVKRFLMVRPVVDGQLPLRLALMRVYASQPRDAVDTQLLTAIGDEVEHENYLVEVGSIDCKLVSALPMPGFVGTMYFMMYQNQSKTRNIGV